MYTLRKVNFFRFTLRKPIDYSECEITRFSSRPKLAVIESQTMPLNTIFNLKNMTFAHAGLQS